MSSKPLPAALLKANQWLLPRARDLATTALRRRDRNLKDLRELRNFHIPGADGDLAARLYCPMQAVEPGPLLLFFHGGGFFVGDLDTHDALCWRLAQTAGVRVLSCLYRLAPEHAFPAQRDDALAAARWTIANGATLGLREGGLSIGGDSAGGYLALATAKTLYDEARCSVRSHILIYPLMHLDDEIWSRDHKTSSRPVGRLAVRYIGDLLAQSAPSLLAPGSLAPIPTLIASGGRLDPCRADAVACADKLQSMGAKVIWREYAALVHGFGNLTHMSRAARRAVDEVGTLAGDLMRETSAP